MFIFVAGSVVIAGGVAMLVLPGPGLVVIVVGLAILAREFVWAAVALEHTKKVAARGGNIVKEGARAARGRFGRSSSGSTLPPPPSG